MVLVVYHSPPLSEVHRHNPSSTQMANQLLVTTAAPLSSTATTTTHHIHGPFTLAAAETDRRPALLPQTVWRPRCQLMPCVPPNLHTLQSIHHAPPQPHRLTCTRATAHPCSSPPPPRARGTPSSEAGGPAQLDCSLVKQFAVIMMPLNNESPQVRWARHS
jgi:hypothetical protein